MDTYLIQQPLVLSGLVQLIQTPTGPAQIVTSTSASGQQQTIASGSGQPVVSATGSSNKNSSTNSSRSNKQILPKPPGSGTASATSSSTQHSHVNHANGASAITKPTNQSSNNSNSSNNNISSGNNHSSNALASANSSSAGPTLASTLQAANQGNGPQILLGAPGKQPMSFISSPPGTFLLNQVIPGLNSQPILIQGNLSGVGGPLQLTLRQQSAPPSQTQVVTVSSANGTIGNVASGASTQTSATPMISALNTGVPQSNVQRSTPSNQVTPTYVFQGHGNSVNGSSTGPATVVMASGQTNLMRGQNIIFRPQNILGAPSPLIQNTTPQFIQIQTPNGPMIVALQATSAPIGSGGQQLIQTSGNPSHTVPITSTMMPLQTHGNNNSANHPTLQTILTSQGTGDPLNHHNSMQHQQQSGGANLAGSNIIFSQTGTVMTSQPIISQANHNSVASTPSSNNSSNNKSTKSRSAKTVNLAELLKETGILPDSSPPQSPSPLTAPRQTLSIDPNDMTTSLQQTELTQSGTSTSNASNLLNVQTSVVNTSHSTVVMVPSQPSQASNIILAPAPNISSGTPPQLRLSLAADGSVVLQPNITSVSAPNSIIQTSPNFSNVSTISVNNSISCTANSNTNSHITSVQDQAATITSISSSKFIDSLRDTCGPGSSQPSPDSTTPTLDASTPTSSAFTPALQANSSSNSGMKSASPSLTTLSAPSTILTSSKPTLMQQLNAGSTMKVGDSVTSMTITPIMGPPPMRDDLKSQSPFIPLNSGQQNELSNSSKENCSGGRKTIKQESKSEQETKTEIVSVPFSNLLNSPNASTSTSSTSVISMNNCDNLVQNSSMPVLLTNTSLIIQEDSKMSNNSANLTSSSSQVLSRNPTSSSSTTTTCTPSLTTQGSAPTLVDPKGYQFVQISLNNHEFIERLETQIKILSALKSPRDEQKQLLHELLSLQKKMSEAKNQPQNSNSGDGKVILTSISPNQPELLLSQTQPTPDGNHMRLQPILNEKNQSSDTQLLQSPEPASTNVQPNLQLVNLLNKNSISRQQLQILTPSSSTTLNGSTTIQVGTQLITIATPAKPSLQPLRTNSSPSLQTSSSLKSPVTPISGGQAVIQVVTLQTPNTASSNSINSKSKSAETITVELDKPKAKISRYFQQQLIADQSAALKPDTKTSFKSRTDACKRLLRYHVFNSPVPNENQLSKVDRDFEVVSQSLLQRKNELFNRFRYNLVKSSMVESPKSESIMLDKLFINDETYSLQTDKEIVAQGKDLNLPPPPESWNQMLRDCLEEEERLLINRKRKSSAMDDDFLAETCEGKKYDIEDHDPTDEEDDQSEENDDDAEDNSAEDISKYLGPNQDNSVPDLSFYPDFNHGMQSLHPDVNLTPDYSQRDDNQDILFNTDWKNNNFLGNRNSRIDVWGNRFDNENDLAVTTILGNDEEPDGNDTDLSVDLNSIQDMHLLSKYACSGGENYGEQMGQDPNENEDDDDYDDVANDDEEEEDEDDGNEHNNGDLQLPCALNSILDSITSMPQPSHQNQTPSPYYDEICPTTSTSGYRPYNNQMHHSMLHSPRNSNTMLADFRNNSPMISDSILDEAVRSISSWSG